jgi:penicillin-binding protein 1A
VEEAATLVGMLKATSYYNPRNYPERAADRRNVVLAQMVKHDFIASSTYEELKRLPVRLDYQPPSSAGESARYFKEYIRKEFNDWTLTTSKSDGSKYDLFKDGLTIVSTLDLDLQNAAESIMEGHMKQLQKIFLESWIGGKIYGSNTKVIDDYITNDKYYKALRNQGASGNEALQHFTKHQSRKLWTWSGMETKSATKIDSIKHYLTLLHTGILAAHPESGAIKVWVGGNDFSRFQYDNITGARQVGSTFKPIVYLAGIQSGLEPCDVFDNDLRTYAQYDDWTPKNSNGQYGGKVTLKGALTHSINTISVQVLFSAGIENVVRLAQQLGVTSKLNKVPSLVLGTSDVSILEMVQVYATLANRGTRANLYGIHQILDQKGNVLFDRTLQNGENLLVADPEAVDILNEMMLNVSVEGTGRRIYQNYRIPYPISGKTGTTQNQSDGWYIGANPDLVIGSWVGTQDRRIHFRNLGTGSGGATALPMVGSLFEYAARNRYLQKKKIPMSHLADCPDYLLDEETIRDEMTNLIESIDDIKKDIMGDYFNLPRRPTSDKKNRINTRKRNQERDKRFKSYKKAVKQLEKQLEDLKDKLDELEEG